ncbi:MAG TPA: bacteriocin [Flavisolibacter sp.]|nr:bacteriocin [Flavisolibacter sp.]
MKRIKGINDPIFKTLEKEKMKKITGGTEDLTSQHNTFTVWRGGGGDDGPDTLSPGEKQDNIQ